MFSKAPVSANRIAALWPASILLLAGLVLLAVHLHPLDLAIWFLVCLAGTYAYWRLEPPDDEKEEVKADKVRSRLAEEETLRSWFDLLKLEYDKAAERYDNIYRAVWQNFSYMAVLAGGILTFGAKDLDPAFASFLALTPLTFWFLATFLPLDHYGDETRKRLSRIEDQINEIYFPQETDPKLKHFKLFRDSKYKWRVREAVAIFGVVVSTVWALMAVLVIHRALDGRPLTTPGRTVQGEPQPSKAEILNPSTEGVRDSLAVLSRRLVSIDSLLRVQLRPPGHVPPTRQIKRRKS
jgi:hypothetical protein